MTGTCWHEPIFIYLPHWIFVSLVCFDHLYPGYWFWWFGLVVWSAGIHLMKRIQLQHPHISPAGSSYEILLRFSHFSQRDSGFHQASTDWLIRLDSLYNSDWQLSVKAENTRISWMLLDYCLFSTNSSSNHWLITRWYWYWDHLTSLNMDNKSWLHLIFFLECPDSRILTYSYHFSGGNQGKHPQDLLFPRFQLASLAAFAPPPPQDMNTSFPGRFNQTACRFQTMGRSIENVRILGEKMK